VSLAYNGSFIKVSSGSIATRIGKGKRFFVMQYFSVCFSHVRWPLSLQAHLDIRTNVATSINSAND
jgi:hypothetical protein